MCRWMGSHFHGWIDYNGIAFSLESQESGHTFSGFGEPDNSGREEFKNGKIIYFVKFNPYVNSFRDDLVKRLYKVDAQTESYYIGIAKNYIFPKVTKMGSTVWPQNRL